MQLINKAIEVYRQKGIYVLAQASFDNIHYAISKKISNKKYPIVKVHNSKMYVSFDDTGLSKQLYLHKTREPETTKIIKKIVKPNMTILEIGANIGYYALMEAKLMNDKGTIYALEPFDKSFNLLKKNVELNNYKSIQTYHFACSNKTSIEKLYVSDHFNTCHMIKCERSNKYIEIATTTVDDFLSDKKQPDLVRMDVEGYEYYIIEGMKNTLKNLKYLVVEWHSSAKRENWQSRINMILDAGLTPIYVIHKAGYQKEVKREIKKEELIKKIEKEKITQIVFERKDKI